MRLVGEDHRPGNGKDHEAETGHRNRVWQHTDPRHQEAADSGADQPAQAPIGVAGRHDGATHRLFHLDRIGIHRHVHGADEAAEEEHGDRR
jgi:hypothetical protein